MLIRYILNMSSREDLKEGDVLDAMAVVENAIKKAYPASTVEIVLTDGPISIVLSDSEIEVGFDERKIKSRIADAVDAALRRTRFARREASKAQ